MQFSTHIIHLIWSGNKMKTFVEIANLFDNIVDACHVSIRQSVTDASSSTHTNCRSAHNQSNQTDALPIFFHTGMLYMFNFIRYLFSSDVVMAFYEWRIKELCPTAPGSFGCHRCNKTHHISWIWRLTHASLKFWGYSELPFQSRRKSQREVVSKYLTPLIIKLRWIVSIRSTLWLACSVFKQ